MFQFVLLSLLAFLALSFASTPEGLAFLAANKDKEGVVTLPSGLQYKVLTSGPEGGLTPKVNSPCDCHYRGYLMDGVTEFDSSYKRGTTTKFAPNQVGDKSVAIIGLACSLLDAPLHDTTLLYTTGH